MEGVGKNWFANTYFYTKLMEDGTYNYKNVRRWTKKINIFECDRMFIPINVSGLGVRGWGEGVRGSTTSSATV